MGNPYETLDGLMFFGWDMPTANPCKKELEDGGSIIGSIPHTHTHTHLSFGGGLSDVLDLKCNIKCHIPSQTFNITPEKLPSQ